MLKKIASKLPNRIQADLRRLRCARAIRRKSFVSQEPEFSCLHQWVSSGDVVIDVGANIGHYTLRLSELVGREGRVFAFEPVPATFAILAQNMTYAENQNITLINCAASDRFETVGIEIPQFANGLDNYYMAAISDDDGDNRVFALPVDALTFSIPLSFIKIDAEGHDFAVLTGMSKILKIHRPVLVVEDQSAEVSSFLRSYSYDFYRLPGSSNRIFVPSG